MFDMNNIPTSLIKIVYNEKNHTRAISTSLSSMISLLFYIKFNDTFIALLSFSAVYPVSRLISYFLIKKYNDKKINLLFNNFSIQEKYLIKKFVRNGSSYCDYEDYYKDEKYIKAFIHRGILKEKDNGFKLNIKIFDKAKEFYNDDSIPF